MQGSHRRKPIRAGVILAIVISLSFVLGVVFYFVKSFITMEYESAVYSTMEEPTLPVIYVVCGDMEINPMKGYYQEMGNEAADTVSPLPEDRKLEIRIDRYGKNITGVRYEIHNLSMSHFIEKTEVEDIRTGGDDVHAVLPIQNLIEKNTQYLLEITLDLGEREVNYYTKILWSDHDYGAQMAALAKDFTSKTFDYETARELTAYMETDPKEENKDLGEVTIGSSYSQLTWGSTGMHPVSGYQVYLRECDGIMGAVEVSYRTKMTVPSGDEEYSNCDQFTMRMGAERIYIMNYNRKTYEVFSGSKHRFAGLKIMLGITNGGVLSTAESPGGQYIAFKTDKELWCYDQVNKKAVNVFSFRSREDDGVRSGWRSHDIKILGVSDTGTIDFAVYGYMNRGRHEGYNGLVYYSYSSATGATTESFFAPFAKSTEKIALELKELCTKGGSEMFFFKQNGTVIAVDLKSLEMMEIVAGLTDGTCLSDAGQTRFAWVENGRYGSDEVKVMNITTGATQSLVTGNTDVFLLLCFSGSDLVLGRADRDDLWMTGRRTRSLPCYKLEIYDEDLHIIMEYEKSGCYIDDFVKDNNRFLFNLYQKNVEDSYLKVNSDTIVCADDNEYSDKKRIGTTESGDKQTVYYVGIDEEIKNTKKLKISVPDSVSYENSGNVEIRAEDTTGVIDFFAYANGRLLGKSSSFQKALNMSYDAFGWITDKNGTVVYNRCDRSTYYTAKEPFRLAQPLVSGLDSFSGNRVTEDGYLLIDALGISLNQVLNFVYKDRPVMVLFKDGTYRLIYGYDTKNIKLYYPAEEGGTSATEVISREAAEEQFALNGNNFLCFARTEQ